MTPHRELNVLLRRCQRAVKTLPDYAIAEAALASLFHSRRKNTDAADVLVKVAALNALYATSVLGVYRMAEHIFSHGERIDCWLTQGDDRAVDRIRRVPRLLKKNGRPRDFYSFATKYCHWQEPERFPMYDQYVVHALRPVRRCLALNRVPANALRITTVFRATLEETRSALGWEDRGYRALDQALWVLGQLLNKNPRPRLSRFVGELPAYLDRP